MPIKDYNTTPANNNASPPNGAPEGMSPNAVNDTMRQLMADTRSFYNQIEWRDWGYVPTYVSATSFTIPSDVTSVAKVGRRVRLVGSGAMGTKYGVIATSSHSLGVTTITVTLDSGSLDNTISNVLFGLDQSNSPFALSASQISGITAFAQTLLDDPDAVTARATLGLLSLALQSNNLTVGLNEAITTVASAATPDIWTGTGNVINYTGTTTTTGFAAAPQAGSRRTLVCASAVQFTAGPNMIIDGGSNFTSAAGDRIHVIAVTTTQFRLEVAKANGQPVSLPSSLGQAKAWVNYNANSAANVSGTYTRSGTTVTCTVSNHGHVTGNRVYCDFTTGTATDGLYTATVIDANTFTVTDAASGATSGNVTLTRRAVISSYNVNSVVYETTGRNHINFTTPMTDANYVTNVNCQTVQASSSYGFMGARSQTTGSVQVELLLGNGTATDSYTSIGAVIFGN